MNGVTKTRIRSSAPWCQVSITASAPGHHLVERDQRAPRGVPLSQVLTGCGQGGAHGPTQTTSRTPTSPYAFAWLPPILGSSLRGIEPITLTPQVTPNRSRSSAETSPSAYQYSGVVKWK